MKTIKLLAIALISTSLITSCGNKDEKKEGSTSETSESSETTEAKSSKLDGTWVIKRATGSMADANIGVIYEFAGNKLTFGTSSFKNPGTTEITDNTFSFQADGNDLHFMYDYEMNGDTLIVKMQGSDQTFYLVKE